MLVQVNQLNQSINPPSPQQGLKDRGVLQGCITAPCYIQAKTPRFYTEFLLPDIACNNFGLWSNIFELDWVNMCLIADIIKWLVCCNRREGRLWVGEKVENLVSRANSYYHRWNKPKARWSRDMHLQRQTWKYIHRHPEICNLISPYEVHGINVKGLLYALQSKSNHFSAC